MIIPILIQANPKTCVCPSIYLPKGKWVINHDGKDIDMIRGNLDGAEITTDAMNGIDVEGDCGISFIINRCDNRSITINAQSVQ